MVAAVAAVASGSGSQVEAAGGVGAAATAAASEVPANVAEARAWIAAYKKRSNK